MATEVTYNGDGSNKTFSITFPFIKSDDVKVQVGGSTLPASDYSITGTVVTTDTAPASGTGNVKLYRTTPIDYAIHDFSAGSTIRAKNLNDNQKQVLYGIEEAKLVTVTSGGITTGAKNDIHVNSDSDWYIRTDAVEQSMLADNSVGTDQIANLSVSTGKIQDDAVTADKLANSINTDIAAIAANTVKVTNATHTGEVTGATALTIADNIVDEANLKVDNTPTNDDVLTAKSSAAGGLTWASLAEAAPAGWQIGFGHASTTTKKEFTEDNSWDDSGLEITYTPKSSSSLLLLEARPLLRCRALANGNYAYFEVRYELDNSGNDLDGAIGISWGYANTSDYAFYMVERNMPVLVTAVYTNSNINQKIFKVQCRAPSGSTNFTMNDNTSNWGLSTAKSYITIKEIAT